MFLAVDLLHQDGVDLRGLPLSERKRDLHRLCVKARVPLLKEVQTFPNGAPSARPLQQISLRKRSACLTSRQWLCRLTLLQRPSKPLETARDFRNAARLTALHPLIFEPMRAACRRF